MPGYVFASMSRHPVSLHDVSYGNCVFLVGGSKYSLVGINGVMAVYVVFDIVNSWYGEYIFQVFGGEVIVLNPVISPKTECQKIYFNFCGSHINSTKLNCNKKGSVETKVFYREHALAYPRYFTWSMPLLTQGILQGGCPCLP